MAKKDSILTVPVPVVNVIAALEQRLEKLDAEQAANVAKEAAFKKQHAAWRQKLIAVARKGLLAALKNDNNIDAWARDNATGQFSVYAKVDASVPVAGDLPLEPVRSWNSRPDYQYQQMAEEIQQAIRILRMTDEKTVPASTLTALSRYL